MLGDSVRRRQPRRKPRSTRRRLGPRFWIPALLGALLVPFGIGYLVAAFLLFPRPELEADSGIPVPSLAGMNPVAAERALAQAGLGRLTVVSFPNPGVPEGQIVAQSPLPGQQLRTGAGVRVGVSTGAPRATVPDVLGESAERAEQALRRAGFEVMRMEAESPVAAGRVFELDPAVGTELRLPAVVTVQVSLGPPAADTTALDTLPAGVPELR